LHGAAMLNQVVTRQAQIIAYIDDFKFMLVLAIIVLPLILLTWSSRAAPARSTDRG
jgi:DHA2 family multidrug resistance protein